MRYALLLAAAALLQAQSKSKAADYPAHVQMDAVTLAAEYLAHSIPTPSATLVANDFLVVDVAFFGPPMSRLRLSPDHFTLRINGHGAPLTTQPFGMVLPDRKKIQSVSLPEGERTLPFSGLIYFHYRGKANNIHSLQLQYDGPMGKYSLKLVSP